MPAQLGRLIIVGDGLCATFAALRLGGAFNEIVMFGEGKEMAPQDRHLHMPLYAAYTELCRTSPEITGLLSQQGAPVLDWNDDFERKLPFGRGRSRSSRLCAPLSTRPALLAAMRAALTQRRDLNLQNRPKFVAAVFGPAAAGGSRIAALQCAGGAPMPIEPDDLIVDASGRSGVMAKAYAKETGRDVERVEMNHPLVRYTSWFEPRTAQATGARASVRLTDRPIALGGMYVPVEGERIHVSVFEIGNTGKSPGAAGAIFADVFPAPPPPDAAQFAAASATYGRFDLAPNWPINVFVCGDAFGFSLPVLGFGIATGFAGVVQIEALLRHRPHAITADSNRAYHRRGARALARDVRQCRDFFSTMSPETAFQASAYQRLRGHAVRVLLAATTLDAETNARYLLVRNRVASPWRFLHWRVLLAVALAELRWLRARLFGAPGSI